jgi:sporulation protein YabP
MALDKTPKWRHQITLVDREELSIEGVQSLGSYDEKEVIAETEQGVLVIKGDGLNLKQLNLDQGNIVVEGLITGMLYEDDAKQKKGLLERFLK